MKRQVGRGAGGGRAVMWKVSWQTETGAREARILMAHTDSRISTVAVALVASDVSYTV